MIVELPVTPEGTILKVEKDGTIVYLGKLSASRKAKYNLRKQQKKVNNEDT